MSNQSIKLQNGAIDNESYFIYRHFLIYINENKNRTTYLPKTKRFQQFMHIKR